MRINQKILSIPPYISTTWKNVSSLHVETRQQSFILVILLVTGARIEIPGLDLGIIKAVFAAHASSVEVDVPPSRPTKIAEHKVTLGMALKSDFLDVFGNMGPLLEHNPERADDPALPTEFVQKIAGLSKTLGIKDSALIPKPEEHCNCMHCQIASALRSGLIEEQEEEEIITDEDLKFRDWDILKTGDKLYSVANPFDAQEKYSVFLGEPVGCTCGNRHCEHVRAVLNS
jgi:hypothetical protein